MSGKHNGNNIAPRTKAKIVELLCAGHSINQVAKATKCHWLCVRAIQWANAAKVEERKQILAERSEHAAADALDRLHAKIADPKEDISPSQLVPVFGVLVDKALALRADPTIQIQHSHAHIHAHINHASFNELLDHLPSSSPQENPTPPSLTDATPESAA